MRLLSLRLVNFRNYKELVFKPKERKNILVGKNASGKTNILESIYFLSTLRSFRTAKSKELTAWGENGFFISAKLQSSGMEHNVKIFISGKKKVVSLNETNIKKGTQLLGVFYTVIFSPSDMDLIKGDPGLRRKFLDVLLSKTSNYYLSALQDYKKVIKQKNKVLKSQYIDKKLIETYNQQICIYGAKIIFLRSLAVNRLNVTAGKIFKNFSRANDNLMVQYFSLYRPMPELNECDIKNMVAAELEKSFFKEIKQKICLVGPHRDDFKFNINGRDAKSFSSEGQKRSIVFCLRLSEYEIVKKKFKEPPVILMDDVFGELDKDKKNMLKLVIDPQSQVFVTCTETDTLAGLANGAERFFVKDGTIQK
ncbi:DNA replication/repair protein RecF [bacterium]|nr:DNA replication/repair protein RecF [bacterium]